jgi:hypothetical protein
MALPWVRLDANIASHDKIVRLVGGRDGYRAGFVYVCALGWSGGQGTDGVIPKAVLPMLHGTERIAKLLIDHGLWDDSGNGSYHIRNFEARQELRLITDAKRATDSDRGRKGNCIRWHGPDCGCWKEAQ